MICDEPDPVTLPPVTSIVSTVESSDVFLIVIFPVSASTLSAKFKTMFASIATPVALSEGVVEFKETWLKKLDVGVTSNPVTPV